MSYTTRKNFLVTFVSGKTITLKKSTGYSIKQETFKNQNGSTYKAQAYVFFFGKGKKIVHYKKSMVRSVKEV